MADTDIVNSLPEPYKYIFENLCLVCQHLDETTSKALKKNILALIQSLPFDEINVGDTTKSTSSTRTKLNEIVNKCDENSTGAPLIDANTKQKIKSKWKISTRIHKLQQAPSLFHLNKKYYYII
jgi:hypothetical protein